MPTEAFFKLDESRKQQIVRAAEKEFSQLPYSKVSIFKIAQQAEVSRSGFYYYFKDKRDIYEYILNEIKTDFLMKNNISSENKTGLFTLVENIFNYITDIRGTEREPLFRRIVSDMTPDRMKKIFMYSENDNEARPEDIIMLDDIIFSSVDELKEIVFLLASCAVYSAGSYYEDEASLEESRDKLHQMFKIIKFGISKGKEE